jgi:hypothetical protein
MDETPADNWDTVRLVNRLSDATLDTGRHFEFTATPMQNVPLGLIKSRKFSSMPLDESQLAVYYACYRHLAKMTKRSGLGAAKGPFPHRIMTYLLLETGALALLHVVESICKRKGLDLEKVKNIRS